MGRLRRARARRSTCSATSRDSTSIELGCGTAYFAAWLARQGARPVGVDVTPAQLETARRMQERDRARHSRSIEANAEDVPLPGCQLRPGRLRVRSEPLVRSVPLDSRSAPPPSTGGRLVFLTNSLLNILCAVEEPDSTSETLQRPQRGHASARLVGRDGVEFHLGHGEWFELLRDAGFDVERLVELYAPDDAETTRTTTAATADWARKWPSSEDLWVARKRADARVDVASATRDPRAAAHPVRGLRARLCRARPARRRPGRARSPTCGGEGALDSHGWTGHARRRYDGSPRRTALREARRSRRRRTHAR